MLRVVSSDHQTRYAQAMPEQIAAGPAFRAPQPEIPAP